MTDFKSQNTIEYLRRPFIFLFYSYIDAASLNIKSNGTVWNQRSFLNYSLMGRTLLWFSATQDRLNNLYFITKTISFFQSKEGESEDFLFASKFGLRAIYINFNCLLFLSKFELEDVHYFKRFTIQRFLLNNFSIKLIFKTNLISMCKKNN